PAVRLRGASSDRWAGAEIAAHVAGVSSELRFSSQQDLEAEAGAQEIAFLATPAEVSLRLGPSLPARRPPVSDPSGAFRLARPDDSPSWYGFRHSAPELLAEAAYGLPELFSLSVSVRLVANPGCYATAAALALAPLLEAGLAEPGTPLLVDGKSGTTGA